MKKILLFVAILLMIGWFLGAFVFAVGKLIYILLVLSILFFLLQFVFKKDDD